MGGDAFASTNVALRAAGGSPSAIENIAIAYKTSETNGSIAAELRSELEAGTLTNTDMKSAGVGAHADSTA